MSKNFFTFQRVKYSSIEKGSYSKQWSKSEQLILPKLTVLSVIENENNTFDGRQIYTVTTMKRTFQVIIEDDDGKNTGKLLDGLTAIDILKYNTASNVTVENPLSGMTENVFSEYYTLSTEGFFNVFLIQAVMNSKTIIVPTSITEGSGSGSGSGSEGASMTYSQSFDMVLNDGSKFKLVPLTFKKLLGTL